MEKTDYWALFLETGAPEYYLLYRSAANLGGETGNVSENSGPCAAGSGIQ